MFHVNVGLGIESPVNLNFHMLHGRKQQFPPECRTVPFRPEVGGVLALTLMLIQLHRRKGKRGTPPGEAGVLLQPCANAITSVLVFMND